MNQECHGGPCPWSAKSHGHGTWCLRSRDPTVPGWTCCLATTLAPYPRVLRTESRAVSTECCSPVGSKNRPVLIHLVPGTCICLAQCIRPIISPLLHGFYCLVKHLCVLASGSGNRECHGWLCPQSAKSHGRGTWCLRSRDTLVSVCTCCLATPLSPCPRVLRIEVSCGVYGMPQPRRPPKNRPIASHLVPRDPDRMSPMYPTSYRPHITQFLLSG